MEKESSPAAFLRCENNNAMVRMWRVNIIFELGRNRVCMKFFRDEYSHLLSLFIPSTAATFLQAAAHRLARYWKMRKTLFGDSRAFLTMTQHGAMENDLGALGKGFVNVLPSDKKGRPVIFFDRIRAIPTVAKREIVVRFMVLSSRFEYRRMTCRVSFLNAFAP